MSKKSGKPPVKSSLMILMIVMVVNALSYGTIIPLLYPYASRFGIDPVGLSMLFASFSLAQFIATPIIGRLSDKYGRKPLLLLCLFGTSLSLALFAGARSVTMLFVARILDGITGGNNSVAQAIIADTTTGPERAKAYGMLGAAFGFGFLFGPALGGVLSQISITAPFWFSALVAFLGSVAGVFLLPETLVKKDRQPSSQPLFPFKSMATAMFTPLTGIVFMITLLTAIGHNAWVIGFQSFTVDQLKMSARDIGLVFTFAGAVNIAMQAVGIRMLLKIFKSEKLALTSSLVVTTLLLIVIAFAETPLLFSTITIVYVLFLSPQMPMVAAILSNRTEGEDQGGVMGLNQAYLSMGQIIGPLIAGYFSRGSFDNIFFATAAIFAAATIASRWLYEPVTEKLDL